MIVKHRLRASVIPVCALLGAHPATADVYEVEAGAVRQISSTPARTTHRVPSLAPDSGDASRFAPAFLRAAQRYAVSPALLHAIARVESNYDPAARSSADAMGIMQLMPGTARELGVDATDPEENIAGGAAYLRRLLDQFDGNIVFALAGYNAGPGAVAKAGGVPPYPETQAYVAAVLGHLASAATPSSRQTNGVRK